MLQSLTTRDTKRLGASSLSVLTPPPATATCRKALPFFTAIALALAALALCSASLYAGPLSLPNASFESPIAPRISPYAGPDMDYWQKSPQPTWYDPSTNYNTPWDYLMGTFYNVPFPGLLIDNCDGSQAAFLFAVPEVAIFQDYDSISGTNTTPSHAFDAHFNTNCAYTLTVGVIGGVSGAPPLFEGATLRLSLYYRDAASNMVMVAATTVTNSAQLFPSNTHFVDFSVYVPGVRASDAWAGQNIGVQIASTVPFDKAGGYWDLDNVRLIETPLPTLTEPRMANSQFGFTLQSQPGLSFEILAATNLSLPLSNWTSLGTLTNETGVTAFFDPDANFSQRFYRAQRLP